MNFITEYFISGKSFFTANIILILAVICSFSYEKKVFKTIVRIFLVAGLLLLMFSPTFISAVMYTIMAFMVFGLFLGLQVNAQKLPFTNIARALLVICCVYVVYQELKYWKMPETYPAEHKKMVVLGDSISSGVKGEKTWPDVIKEKYGIEVNNYSEEGATAESSVDRTEVIYENNILVVVELGEADVDRRTPITKFTASLDKILSSLAKPGRTVVMFEVPNPPTQGSYSHMQRYLAKKHGVYLIPKYVMASILCGSGMTEDGLHLSGKGREKMAETVWNVVKNSFKKRLEEPKKAK